MNRLIYLCALFGEGIRYLNICVFQKRLPRIEAASLLYNENPAIVAGFHKGYADERKANKNSA